jgi:hypothetical protein
MIYKLPIVIPYNCLSTAFTIVNKVKKASSKQIQTKDTHSHTHSASSRTHPSQKGSTKTKKNKKHILIFKNI